MDTITDLMDAGEAPELAGGHDRVYLSVRVPKGAEQDRLKVLAEYDRMESGCIVLVKQDGRLSECIVNGVKRHGRRGWRDDHEAMYEVGESTR